MTPKEKIAELEGQLMLIGMNRLAYTEIWNATAEKLEKPKEK